MSNVTTSDIAKPSNYCFNAKKGNDIGRKQQLIGCFYNEKLIKNSQCKKPMMSGSSTPNPQLENIEFEVAETIDNMIKLTNIKSRSTKQKENFEKQKSNVNHESFDAGKKLLQKLRESTIDNYRKEHSFLSLDNNQNQNQSNAFNHITQNDLTNYEDIIFTNKTFHLDLFESFDFENRLKQCVYLSLSDKPENINKYYKHDQWQSSKHNDDESVTNDLSLNSLSNIKIIDACLSEDINLFSRTRKANVAKEKTPTTNKEEDNKTILTSMISKAVPEFKRLLMSYQQTTSMSKRSEISYLSCRDEELNNELIDYFKTLIQEERSKYLKNKLKIIMKLINNVDKITNIPVYHNTIKNQLLSYWKTEYEKEVEEFTLKKKEEVYRQIIIHGERSKQIHKVNSVTPENKRTKSKPQKTSAYSSKPIKKKEMKNK